MTARGHGSTVTVTRAVTTGTFRAPNGPSLVTRGRLLRVRVTTDYALLLPRAYPDTLRTERRGRKRSGDRESLKNPQRLPSCRTITGSGQTREITYPIKFNRVRRPLKKWRAESSLVQLKSSSSRLQMITIISVRRQTSVPRFRVWFKAFLRRTRHSARRYVFFSRMDGGFNNNNYNTECLGFLKRLHFK